jgi:hypothetical protein
MRFKRRRGAVFAKVDRVEATVLASLVGELLELLAADDDEPGEQDPLAAMVGLPSGDGRKPEDPGLARLFPDAYSGDGAQEQAAAQDFRRYTEADLRAGKRANAETVLAALTPVQDAGGALVLSRDQVDAWLGTLNDLRLVLGTRLAVTEDTDLDPEPGDPRAHALHVYGFLGWLQESLLGAVDPLTPGS